jgi:hypothetical protein
VEIETKAMLGKEDRAKEEAQELKDKDKKALTCY